MDLHLARDGGGEGGAHSIQGAPRDQAAHGPEEMTRELPQPREADSVPLPGTHGQAHRGL